MSSKRPPTDPATEARRLELALQWREDLRRETARSADPAPARLKPEPQRSGADFASAMARAELGRSYLDPRTNRQAIENGAVVMKAQGPPRRRKG